MKWPWSRKGDSSNVAIGNRPYEGWPMFVLKEDGEMEEVRRVDWNSYFMMIAEQVATRGTCDRKQVGCVLVKDKRILATGYNGSISGADHCYDVGHLMEEDHCVSGDTVISKFQSGHYNTGHRTIKEIYDFWNGGHQRGPVKLMNIRTVSPSGEIVSGKIDDVWNAGKKETFEVKTSLGRSVKATKDHRFFSKDNEWVPLEELSIGDYVALNGKAAYKSKAWLEREYSRNGKTMVAVAKRANCSRTTIRLWLKHYNIDIREFKLGGWNKGLIREESHSYGGDMVLPSSARERSRRYALKDKCEVCGSTENLQVHHSDLNYYNDSYANLRTLCLVCHTIAHTPHAKLDVVKFDKIVSIKRFGMEDVFDITVSPFGNFIGNGVVLHNCVRTVHSEINALAQCAKYGISCDGAMVYINTFPCWECFKALVNAGIKSIYYRDSYKSRGKNKVFEMAEQLDIPLVQL